MAEICSDTSIWSYCIVVHVWCFEVQFLPSQRLCDARADQWDVHDVGLHNLFPCDRSDRSIIGALFDAKRPRLAIVIMNTFSLIHVATAATTTHWLQYLSFACVGLHRSALFGGLPQYLAYFFPPTQLGTLMAISTFCGGFCAGVEYLMTWIVVNHGQHRFRAVCAVLTFFTVLWYGFPALMRVQPFSIVKKADIDEIGHPHQTHDCGPLDPDESVGKLDGLYDPSDGHVSGADDKAQREVAPSKEIGTICSI